MNLYHDGPPRPWDHPRDLDRHRGRGPISMVRGEPLDVEFLGWRSNTAELQRHGWQMAESKVADHYEDRERWHIQIMHPKYRIGGLSRPIHWQQRGHRSNERMMNRYGGQERFHLHIDLGLPFQVQRMEPMHMYAIDAQPYHQTIHRPVDLYDMPYFQPLNQGKDVFLAQASVDEIMQIALDKQMPEQAEIRARKRQEQKREDYHRGGEVKGRIILVA